MGLAAAEQAQTLAWAKLIHRIALGDRAALASLYDESRRLVYGLALRIVRTPATAEDVLMETYSSVWRKAVDFDEKRGTAAVWLLLLARSRALDQLRAESRHVAEHDEKLLAVLPGEGDPEASADLERRRRAVQRSLEALPESGRQALELAYFEGLSQTEIAGRLGEPLGTIKARIRRALQKLRDDLETRVEP